MITPIETCPDSYFVDRKIIGKDPRGDLRCELLNQNLVDKKVSKKHTPPKAVKKPVKKDCGDDGLALICSLATAYAVSQF